MEYGSIQFDIEEFGKLPDKEFCIVCLIIVIFNVSFTGAIIYLIQGEGTSQSSQSY